MAFIVKCAWCGVEMGHDDTATISGTSHGICAECRKVLEQELEEMGFDGETHDQTVDSEGDAVWAVGEDGEWASEWERTCTPYGQGFA